jgi:hypothetical protein
MLQLAFSAGLATALCEQLEQLLARAAVNA